MVKKSNLEQAPERFWENKTLHEMNHSVHKGGVSVKGRCISEKNAQGEKQNYVVSDLFFKNNAPS